MIAEDSPPKQVFIYPAQVPQTPLPLVEKIPGTTPGLLHSSQKSIFLDVAMQAASRRIRIRLAETRPTGARSRVGSF